MTNADLNNTPEIIAAKQACAEELSVIRMKMLQDYPFIGSIAMKLEVIPVRDVRVPTACTDGSRVYVDVAFFESLSKEEKRFLFAHEVWHCVLMHMIRKQSREVSLFNIATDKEINYLLKNDGFTLIPDCCYPEQDEMGLSAEQIYEKLIQKQNKQNQQNSNNNGNQFDDHIYDGNSATGDGQESDSDNSKNEGRSKSKDGKISDKYGEVGNDSDFESNPASVDKDFADKMKENIISSAMEVSQRSKGSLPDYIGQMIEKMLEPEFNWKELLSQFITKINLEKKSWTRPNRRHIWQDEYVQGRYDESLNVCCLVDTSGSCSSDLTKFMSELSGLIASFGDYNLTVIECDTEIKNISEYNNTNPFPVDNISKIKMYGGGGSDFRPAFDKICEDLSYDDNKYNIIVVFTDGYIDVPRYNQTGKEIIWVLTKDGSAPADYGYTIKFNETK